MISYIMKTLQILLSNVFILGIILFIFVFIDCYKYKK